jgi:hypothetical protein
VAAKILVESHIARVRDVIWTLQHNLDILLQSITNAKKGILQPQVSLKLIIDMLVQSMPSFPKDTMPPFSLSKNSLNLVYTVGGSNCDLFRSHVTGSNDATLGEVG